MDLARLKAIDIHVHAEISCHDPEDPILGEFFDASTAYFKADRRRPTIPETIAYYRERDIGFVMFTVDMEAGTGSSGSATRRSPRPPPPTATSCSPSPRSIRTRANMARSRRGG
jgi:hypothetical protein